MTLFVENTCCMSCPFHIHQHKRARRRYDAFFPGSNLFLSQLPYQRQMWIKIFLHQGFRDSHGKCFGRHFFFNVSQLMFQRILTCISCSKSGNIHLSSNFSTMKNIVYPPKQNFESH